MTRVFPTLYVYLLSHLYQVSENGLSQAVKTKSDVVFCGVGLSFVLFDKT